MISEDWLTVAEALNANGDPARRRAVSTAYYACFHALAHLAAQAIAPAEVSAVDQEVAYRAIDHRDAVRGLKEFAARSGRHDAQVLAEAFRQLQLERMAADYRPEGVSNWTANRVDDLIDLARASVETLRGLGAAERVSLAVNVLLKKRDRGFP